MEGDITALGRLLGVVLRELGHEPGHGLFDQPVELGRTDLVCEGGHLLVDVAGGFPGEAEQWQRRRVGLATAPHPRPTAQSCPVAGAAGTSAPASGRSRCARSRWNGRWRARTPRCRTRRRSGSALAGQRSGQSPAGRPRRGDLDRLRRMLLRPGHRRPQQVGFRPDRRDPAVPGKREHVGRRVELRQVVRGRRHGLIQPVNTDSFRKQNPRVDRGFLLVFANQSAISGR